MHFNRDPSATAKCRPPQPSNHRLVAHLMSCWILPSSTTPILGLYAVFGCVSHVLLHEREEAAAVPETRHLWHLSRFARHVLVGNLHSVFLLPGRYFSHFLCVSLNSGFAGSPWDICLHVTLHILHHYLRANSRGLLWQEDCRVSNRISPSHLQHNNYFRILSNKPLGLSTRRPGEPPCGGRLINTL